MKVTKEKFRVSRVVLTGRRGFKHYVVNSKAFTAWLGDESLDIVVIDHRKHVIKLVQDIFAKKAKTKDFATQFDTPAYVEITHADDQLKKIELWDTFFAPELYLSIVAFRSTFYMKLRIEKFRCMQSVLIDGHTYQIGASVGPLEE